MIKVTIIGSGNVAQHLINVFLASAQIELVQVFARKKESVLHLLDFDKIVTAYTDLKEADLYILAVSDGAISTVSSQLPFVNKLVVHTSGNASITALDDKNRKGVFYPLQTFSKNKPIDFSVIPICLETENPTDFQLIDKVAKSISTAVFTINSQQRKALHVAAVFVNNFTNHLYQIGQDICEEHQIPFGILMPLIQETAQKIKTLSPQDAQTGPARRHDETTIQSHENFLTHDNQILIYKILTQSIQNHGKKL
ncbi:Rossmann-like and DUF2520 domain-containing protein [Flavobacterium restrictum]|uniref:DUF2520 domain-containing protein n=1 Tax=Flavobacterium restrictum TaxID=2594428 RepID=A0A553E3X8_9FLAO|nr:Rossmann-like and DUF2520 domain-containing protein [Flavobacterium restrictum]TRX39729.1 DUF2520 domain-containing protein [Flavobacterium restrictum]